MLTEHRQRVKRILWNFCGIFAEFSYTSVIRREKTKAARETPIQTILPSKLRTYTT